MLVSSPSHLTAIDEMTGTTPNSESRTESPFAAAGSSNDQPPSFHTNASGSTEGSNASLKGKEKQSRLCQKRKRKLLSMRVVRRLTVNMILLLDRRRIPGKKGMISRSM